jgi:hypothetical protein
VLFPQKQGIKPQCNCFNRPGRPVFKIYPVSININNNVIVNIVPLPYLVVKKNFRNSVKKSPRMKRAAPGPERTRGIPESLVLAADGDASKLPERIFLNVKLPVKRAGLEYYRIIGLCCDHYE